MTPGYDLIAATARCARRRRRRASRRRSAPRRSRLPSWAFGNSGTRFAVFAQPGVPRDPFEKLEDAAEVHRLTGIAPSVALHIPWDRVDDLDALRAHAAELGLRLGAINPNLFQEPEYKLGSLCHPDAGPSPAAPSTTCSSASRSPTQVGSTAISLWLADGTNYPGQDSLRGAPRAARSTSLAGGRTRARRRRSSCSSSTSSTSRRSTRPISPTGAPRSSLCQALGERAKVLVDLGHHAQGVNIEQIVSLLARRGPARRLPLQRPQVRRRRPDRRLDRSVPALPDLLRARRTPARSRAASGSRSTSRTTSSRRSRR